MDTMTTKEQNTIDLAYMQAMYTDKPDMCWLYSHDADLAEWVKGRG